MELRVLEYFVVVANELNITRAANLLHITQPTLSRQIHDLEAELGVKLFVRRKSAIVLTEEGQYLKDQAAQIVALAQAVKLNVAGQNRQELSGVLSIGIAECRGTRDLLPRYLQKFRQLHPGVKINLYSNIADTVKNKLNRGLLDAAIVLEPTDTGKYGSFRLPVTERWGLLMSHTDPLARYKRITKDNLTGAHILYPERLELQLLFEHWMGEALGCVSVDGYFNTTACALLLMCNSSGKAFTINGTVPEEGAEVCFRPLYPYLETHSTLIWNKGRAKERIIEEFIKIVKMVDK